MSSVTPGLTVLERTVKRAFDICVAGIGLCFLWWLIGGSAVLARLDTGRSGLFRQTRAGLRGERFDVLKIRTMRDVPGFSTTVTTGGDPRITRLGRFFRRSKIDELPQLWNVFTGRMSFVGPRPDVPEYADALTGDDRLILEVRPGITGPATLKYRDEEELLARQSDPQRYNDEVIFPDKVRINRDYVLNYSFRADLRYIWRTLAGGKQ
jgi:lipopolysaccharide/colanic/teichoic acid biosynthesis glycosyltransferase